MDSISNGVKRKKRKTRKCLDELRKRSRFTNDAIEKQSPILNNVNKKGRKANVMEIKPQNITSNRLTLAMFPKVIRSETITRPLPEIIENPGLTFPNLAKETKSKTNTVEIISQLPSNSDSDFIEDSEEEFVNNCATDSAKSREMRSMSVERDNESENHSIQNNSPHSLVLLSPAQPTEDSDSFVVSPYATSSTSTSSSQSSRAGYSYHLYEEFMNEIPVYLKQNIPALIKDDVIKKSKAYLHNIYMEGCRRECEDNILQCMRSSVLRNKCLTPPEPTVQNPLEYLRLSHTAHKRLRPATEHNALKETPEYTYYPHKLNH